MKPTNQPHHHTIGIEKQTPTQRLDKWLWAARFFKTRPLAFEAVNGGKVHLEGQRTKPGKAVRPGMRITIHKGPLEWQITVKKISPRRGSASQAATLYTEDKGSIRKREQIIKERHNLQASAVKPEKGRPTKRQRRQIKRFTEFG